MAGRTVWNTASGAVVGKIPDDSSEIFGGAEDRNCEAYLYVSVTFIVHTTISRTTITSAFGLSTLLERGSQSSNSGSKGVMPGPLTAT